MIHELTAIWRTLTDIKETQVSQQEEINTLTATLAQVAADLEADTTSIQAELNTLENEKVAGNPLDLSALKTAVEALKPKAEALGALKPAEAAPKPTKTVYVFTAAEGVSADERFTDSGFRSSEGQTLYYFSGDTQPEEQEGGTVPGYSVYSGAVKPA